MPDSMQTLLAVFIIAMAVAVIIQVATLVALYVTLRRSAQRVDTLAQELRTRALPLLDNAGEIIADARPKLAVITSDLVETSATLKTQAARLDHTISDIADRTRLQVIRADEMVNRTLSKVEQTSSAVQQTVSTPIRQVNGVISGIIAGLSAFVRGTQGRDQRHPDEEMFI